MSSSAATSPPPVKCRFGLFEFDFRSSELRREGQVVKLSPQPARVLALLLARPGEVVLREELRAHLWGDETFVDFERGLNFCIVQVRGALGDSADNPRFVQTVPRKGYRFIAPVAAPGTSVPPETGFREAGTSVPPETPFGHAATSVPPETPSGHAATSVPPATATSVLIRRRWVAIPVAIILAPLVWLTLASRATPPPGASSPERIRIVVLPFANLTGDSAADYLADGLTDEVIAQLGRLGGNRLAVIARTSAMTYRNTSKTVAEIGRELNATYVVESSVRQTDEGLRIATSLVPARDQSAAAVWSETFATTSSDTSHTNAAIRLARLIALELAPDARSATVTPATSNIAAWEAFLRGRAAMNRGTPDDVKRASRAFDAAVQHDPMLAAGWAKIVEARHLLVMMGALAPADAYPTAREAAQRALGADPNLPDSHVAHGLVQLWYDHKPAEAAASFERALALNASHAAALHDYAWTMLARGRDAEAVSYITAARDLDPLSTRANTDIGWLYLQLGQPDEAIRACQHTLAIHAESLEAQACLERAYVHRGSFDAAVRVARATMPSGHDFVLPRTAETGLAAMQAIWRWRLARLERASRTRWVSPYTLATLLIMIGESQRAIDELEAAVDQRVAMIPFLNRDPVLDPLRREPRFQALLARVNETSP